MGGGQSKRALSQRHHRRRRPPTYLQFEDFEILRSIGRGTYGKVCLVERKENQSLLAMKYINKERCEKQRAIDNILAEVELLRALDHPFIVRLCYTFQDAEDLFLILEPLMGGDLRFHLNNEEGFSEESVRFICAEMSLALDHLRSRNIIHRDVKPDNILLDDQGHAHLTDFNVATSYQSHQPPLRTLAGTKPYIAREIFQAAAFPASPGYDFAVDWWSLGVTAFELKTGQRPYDIGVNTSLTEAIQLLEAPWPPEDSAWPPVDWSPEFAKFLQSLLQTLPENRATSWSDLQKTKLMANLKSHRLLSRKVPPPFVPSTDALNCDPTFELEEMMVESKPLHKKKKRLLRQQSLLSHSPLSSQPHASEDPLVSTATKDDKFKSFPNYSREYERYQASLRQKELEWELELMKLMEASSSVLTATLAAGQPSVASNYNGDDKESKI